MTQKVKVATLAKLLDQIRAADIRQAKSQLEIANILAAIRGHKLWEPEGYESFAAMVNAELSFSMATATQYISLHKSYTRLKYTEAEFIKLLSHFSWRKVSKALVHSTRKMGIRAINNYWDGRSDAKQFNFNFTDKQTASDFAKLLENYGMEVQESGIRTHMTDALKALISDYVALKAVTAPPKGKASETATVH